MTCDSCGHEIGPTTHITHGYIGSYRECEYCFEGKPRPAEPELITDTFDRPVSFEGRSLDRIIDKLTGEK